MTEFNPPPEPTYERDINRLIQYYRDAVKEVVYTLRSYDLNDIDASLRKELIREITKVLNDLDVDSKEWVEENIPRAYREGQAATLVTIGEAATLDEALKMISFSNLNKYNVAAFIDDTYGDLLQATQNTKRKVKQTIREVVSEQLRAKATQNLGRRTMTRDVVQDLQRRLGESANFAIKDRANRTWKIEDYANVVVRSKIQQSHIEGTRNQAIEREVYYAVISSHGANDACRFHEGRIVKLTPDADGNYPTISELRATGQIFHPNCKHSVHPVRSPDLLPPSVRDKAEKQYERGQRASSTGKRNPKDVD